VDHLQALIQLVVISSGIFDNRNSFKIDSLKITFKIYKVPKTAGPYLIIIL